MNILAIIALIGQAGAIVEGLRRLLGTLQRTATDPTLRQALAAAPNLSRDVAELSRLVRTVQESAGHVISNKNWNSKVSEGQRLGGHVKALAAAFSTDTHDPKVLAEVGSSPVLQHWLSEVTSEWSAVQGALGSVVRL